MTCKCVITLIKCTFAFKPFCKFGFRICDFNTDFFPVQKQRSYQQVFTGPGYHGTDLAIAGPDLAIAEPDLAIAGPDLAIMGPDLPIAGPDLALAGQDIG